MLAMAPSSSALKLAAACMLLWCVASDLTRPAMASSSRWPDQDQESTARGMVRELVDHDLAEQLGLQGQRGGNVGDICSQTCQTCLIVCAVTCVLVKEPIACFANCTVSSSCFGKPVAPSPLPLGGVRA